MKKALIYIHGKGGSASESGHYAHLLGDYEATGLEYSSMLPWEAAEKIHASVCRIKEEHESVLLVANSIGAFLAMNSEIEKYVERAFFISPVVDMEKLITDMMAYSAVSESQLQEKCIIRTSLGEELSWDYLMWVRNHPVKWSVPTMIVYGNKDSITSPETIRTFALKHGASLEILEGGEHWFHTPEQMKFLDSRLKAFSS